MLLNKHTNDNYTTRQLKLPLEIEKIIDISDPVYTFCDVMDHIDLSKYFVEAKGYKTGRPQPTQPCFTAFPTCKIPSFFYTSAISLSALFVFPFGFGLPFDTLFLLSYHDTYKS